MSECQNRGGGSWEGLRATLDAEDHIDFTNRVEACMRMKEKVNIKKIVRSVSENLGASYGPIAEKVLRRAAMRTDIRIIGDDNA